MKKLMMKAFGVGVLMVMTAGVVLAATFSQTIVGNTVSAAGANLILTITGKPLSGVLNTGEFTSGGTIHIVGDSNKNGSLYLDIQPKTTANCDNVVLEIYKGTSADQANLIDKNYIGTVNRTINLDLSFAKNGDLTIYQRAGLSSGTGDCGWDEVVRFVN